MTVTWLCRTRIGGPVTAGLGRARSASLVFGLVLSVLVVSSTGAEEVVNPVAPDADRPPEPEAREASSANASPGRGPGQLPWAVTLYGGVYMNNTLGEMFTFQFDPQDSYLGVLAVSREIATLTKHIRFELEGQVAKNFGEQNNWELNALLVARWVTFPWNDYVYTTFAVGDGLSYATSVPKLEEQFEGSSEQLLNYLMFELTLSPPQHPEWAFVTRIHHRSALFGAFGHGGSNVLTAGIKYRF